MYVQLTEGEFHSPQADRCKFRVGRETKGINPMALAINIQTTFTEKEEQSQLSFNENPMAVALTIDAPNPPVPQQPFLSKKVDVLIILFGLLDFQMLILNLASS